ncbi:hypothetical protein [Pseudoalteromonas sp. Ld20]|uniref:hypothetical protein n=1 Tax=Pseudoalteromonas sp. Ld20 TaxID=649165 RepID=UPI00386611F2
MGVRFKTILMVYITVLGLAGCELIKPSVNDNEQAIKVVEPNPKPRPKSEPMYPPAEVVIGWHAKACGGFKATDTKAVYIGAAAIERYFDFSCKNNSLEPTKVLAKLLQLDQAFYWPDDIKQYLWLQKQQIKQQISAQKAQQALNDKMQKTMSSLATIEQQLLLREETKEH